VKIASRTIGRTGPRAAKARAAASLAVSGRPFSKTVMSFWMAAARPLDRRRDLSTSISTPATGTGRLEQIERRAHDQLGSPRLDPDERVA
jgi:hypothetical protein